MPNNYPSTNGVSSCYLVSAIINVTNFFENKTVKLKNSLFCKKIYFDYKNANYSCEFACFFCKCQQTSTFEAVVSAGSSVEGSPFGIKTTPDTTTYLTSLSSIDKLKKSRENRENTNSRVSKRK